MGCRMISSNSGKRNRQATAIFGSGVAELPSVPGRIGLDQLGGLAIVGTVQPGALTNLNKRGQQQASMDSTAATTPSNPQQTME
jgi:hypothetical protein